jgi:hypothetical protein
MSRNTAAVTRFATASYGASVMTKNCWTPKKTLTTAPMPAVTVSTRICRAAVAALCSVRPEVLSSSARAGTHAPLLRDGSGSDDAALSSETTTSRA